MTEIEARILADLSVLKNQMSSIVGNGQPGRLGAVEDRVLKHEQALQRMKGSAAAFGGLLTILHVAIDFIGNKH